MREIRKGFEEDDAIYLRKIANNLAEKAAVETDSSLAHAAVIAYALSKLLSKPHFHVSPRWPKYRRCVISALDNGPKEALAEIERWTREIDEADGAFVRNIIDKARIKMAARAYSVGISIQTAVDLFRAPLKDLMEYVGQTKIHEGEYKISISDRLTALRRMMRNA